MYTFYCDESGNTGNNYLDLKDPFFVLGGWLVKDSFKNQDLANMVTGTEFKSSKMMKNPTGRKKVKVILNVLLDAGCIPFMAIVDKKYALAARMEDVLLDPKYNNMLPVSITRDEYTISKKDLANMFYQVDELIIEDFAKAYRTLNSSDMKQCITQIAECLSDKGNNELAKLTLNSIAMIDKNLSDEAECIKNQAPNVFSLNTLMFIINKYAIKEKISVGFIHDNQKEYSDNFQNIASAMLQEREELIRYAFKERMAMYNKITDFKLEDSKDNLLIQCADILVGAINHILKKLKSGKKFDITEKEILEIVWKYIIQWNSPQTTHFMIEDTAFYQINDTVKNLIG